MTRKYGVTLRRSAPLRLPMHPSAPDHGAWRRWIEESERPIAIDLFSGAGGLSHGLEAAGYRVALAVDTDEWALETHAHNFEGIALRLDLAEEDVRDAIIDLFNGIDVALVAAGPPCQPFSRAGRSKIKSLVEAGARGEVDVRQELWRAFLDIVERLQPRTVLMENVPDMALGDDMAVLRHMIDRLESCGYEADARIVDAWLYGVPQHRQRLLVAGVQSGGMFRWPEPTGRVTLRDAISDLPTLRVRANEEVGDEVMPYAGPTSDFSRRARKQCVGDAANTIHDHVTRAVRPDDLTAFRLMKRRTLYSDLPVELRRYRSDIFDDKYNRLAWDALGRSITAHIAKDGYWYIHPQQHRTLTIREAARIQTFPDHFRFAGSRSHQFTQIGNAVPPALGEAIGSALLNAIRDEPSSAETASQWRREVRDALHGWIEADRETTSWAYPGEVWPVLVGLILGRRAGGWPAPTDALSLVSSLADATPPTMALLEAMADSGPRRRAVIRLRKVVTAIREDFSGGAGWIEAAGLRPSDRDWLGLLIFQDGLVASTAVLRVVARLTATDVDRQNRLSAGRMELAKLVGDGEGAALLNAGLHRIGTTVCLRELPQCHTCPLHDVCHGRPS